MLGEDHSLLHEFPEYKAIIAELTASDPSFADDAKRYDALDKEIRELELQNTPVGDQAMHDFKHNRSVLKDSLYQRLLAANTSDRV